MKIAILGYAGGVGKTTLAGQLFSPRMNGAPVFAIETINETAAGLGLEVEKMSGDQFRSLYKKIMVCDDALVDIGASNVEDFLVGMVKHEDSYMEFDYYIVPITSGTKEQKETISMIATLADFGIQPEKIRVVFNRVSADVEEEFSAFLNYVRKEKTCVANPEAAIFENELFDLLGVKKTSIAKALADDTDYRSKAREATQAGDQKLAYLYTDLHVIKALSRSVNRNLDSVFEILFRDQVPA